MENKITMINIWGTYCTSCINELKELEEIHCEFKDKELGVLGIIFDVNSENPKKRN